jgi:hypothetical protein
MNPNWIFIGDVSSMRNQLHLLGMIFASLLIGHLSSARGDESSSQSILDLSNAVVVAPASQSGPQRQAVRMLVEEVERRTNLRWPVQVNRPEDGKPVVIVGSGTSLDAFNVDMKKGPDGSSISGKAEGFRAWTDSSRRTVIIQGNDDRGVLFGIGRVLRELRMGQNRVGMPGSFRVVTSPAYPLRGHQLGYRPKTNSYDGWDLDQWETYIRDLAVFGVNTVELIPPTSDDEGDSPHFPRPPMEMMIGMSRLLDRYGLNVGIWYPAMEKGAEDPEVVSKTLASWDETLRQLPRVDAIFVPGGDPGHSEPKHLMPFLEKATEVLHRHHPRAEMWVSPQGFDQKWLDQFYELLKKEPVWLTGLVYGPHTRADLESLRDSIPSRYPIRLYPDITHTMKCQFPVEDWHLAFWLTEGREPINPRPRASTIQFRAVTPGTRGFVSYSEGCNDDVNKFIWSALGWDPDSNEIETLRQYSRYFIGDRFTDGFAQGLRALERNWIGSPSNNPAIEITLRQFQDMERVASPNDLRNWRFQQALFRAYYDSYVRDRHDYESNLEHRAIEIIRRASEVGSREAIARAQSILSQATSQPVSQNRRTRVFELGAALFQSIHMQLSVPRYGAIGEERGANLDSIDAPLNNRAWLEKQFREIRELPLEAERVRKLEELTRRTDPGAGGYYDELGDPDNRPHLIPGPGYDKDPMLRLTRTGIHKRPEWPLFWMHTAESLYDAPLKMRYTDLEPDARYRVRVIYTGGIFTTRIRLQADGVQVHPYLKKPDPVHPVEFEIPVSATKDGTLELTWNQEPGRGGNGRGCQIAEVWLIRERSR